LILKRIQLIDTLYLLYINYIKQFLFYRNFIRCDIVAFEDFHKCNGDKVKVILEGRLKSETKKYVMNDGDIILEFFYHKAQEI